MFLIFCKRDRADTTIAIGFMFWRWNYKGWHVIPIFLSRGDSFIGLDIYVKRKGYNDPVLLKLAMTFHTFLSEIPMFHSRFPTFFTYTSKQFLALVTFIDCMWMSLGTLEPNRSDELSEDESQFVVWTEIFKICNVLMKK